jgi:hypothetical protein
MPQEAVDKLNKLAAKSKHKVSKDPIYRMGISANDILDFDPDFGEIPENNGELDPLQYEGPTRDTIVPQQDQDHDGNNRMEDTIIIENADDLVTHQQGNNVDIIEELSRENSPLSDIGDNSSELFNNPELDDDMNDESLNPVTPQQQFESQNNYIQDPPPLPIIPPAIKVESSPLRRSRSGRTLRGNWKDGPVRLREQEIGLHITIKKAIEKYGHEATDAIMSELKQMVDKKVWHPIDLKLFFKKTDG